MTKFKSLLKEIHDVETLTAKDVFNFYYLWHTSLHSPNTVASQYGKDVMEYYLNQLQAKYVKLFTRLMAKQVAKYVSRQRTDADFPVDTKLDSASPEQLLSLMQKTFRSDMTRRNDLWILVGEFLVKLARAQSPKDKFLYINQLNNAIHNTQTKVLGKLENYYTELNRAFDMVDKAKNVEALRKFVDKDIRDLKDQDDVAPDSIMEGGLEKIVMSPDMLKQLAAPTAAPSSFATDNPTIDGPKFKDKGEKKDDIDSGVPPELKITSLEEEEEFDFYGNAGKKVDNAPQGKATDVPQIKKPTDKDKDKKSDPFKIGPLQEALDSGSISKEDRANLHFMTGLKQGVKDKAADIQRDVSGEHPDFVRGYKTVKRAGWWDKFNDKLTAWASEFGKSYGRRF